MQKKKKKNGKKSTKVSDNIKAKVEYFVDTKRASAKWWITKELLDTELGL